MPFSPTKGDRFILLGNWYNADALALFISKCRNSDFTTREVRQQLLADLIELPVTKFTINQSSLSTDLILVPENEGDWLRKFTQLRQALTTRGTNKGPVNGKGTSKVETPDNDLADDQVKSFWEVTVAFIKELKGWEYVYDSTDLTSRYNFTPAQT